MNDIPKFASGVARFKSDVYPGKKQLYERLSHGQSPEALFITCSDSRIQISTITQTDPGELFICRNAGNIVPPHTNHTGGTTAAIEFSVAALQVSHIVVCGHTGCAAMEGAMLPNSIKHLQHTQVWLGYARAAVEVVNEIAVNKTKTEKMQLLLEQNIILQLRHLTTHPSVAAKLAKGTLTLHGWLYDIRSGQVQAYDESTATFVNVDEYYGVGLGAT